MVWSFLYKMKYQTAWIRFILGVVLNYYSILYRRFRLFHGYVSFEHFKNSMSRETIALAVHYFNCQTLP